MAAGFRIIVGGDEDGRSVPAFSSKLLREFYPRHGTELDVEYQTAELRTILVRQKRLRRGISDRLKARCPQ